MPVQKKEKQLTNDVQIKRIIKPSSRLSLMCKVSTLTLRNVSGENSHVELEESSVLKSPNCLCSLVCLSLSSSPDDGWMAVCTERVDSAPPLPPNVGE